MDNFLWSLAAEPEESEPFRNVLAMLAIMALVIGSGMVLTGVFG
ncbi:hypothetical protein [Nitratireductor sp. StC3]|nr:hypothetical protein [Nitratireductor sp. StC3]